MRFFLVLAFAPAVALAQPAPPADSVAVAATDSTTVSDVALFSFTALADAARPSEVPPAEPEPMPEPPMPTPTLHVLGSAGVTFLAPIGWDGSMSSVENVGYALYTSRNETAVHPLAGAVIRVERVAGLNPLLRERFARGQTTYGTHGATPVGPAAVPWGFGVEVRGPGTGGATAYIERGAFLWTVSVQAPTAVWATRRGDVLALLSAVTLP